MRRSYVYIMSSAMRTLYVGVTANLMQRVWQHKQGTKGGYTALYNVNRLVYFERFWDIRRAIAREKQLKGWRRDRKLVLILAQNPEWKDLSAEWGPEWESVVKDWREEVEQQSKSEGEGKSKGNDATAGPSSDKSGPPQDDG
jgi:putative endonuclease